MEAHIHFVHQTILYCRQYIHIRGRVILPELSSTLLSQNSVIENSRGPAMHIEQFYFLVVAPTVGALRRYKLF